MNTTKADPGTRPFRLQRRGMLLADKLGLAIFLILTFAVALSSLLNYFNFQKTYGDLVRSSYSVMLRDMTYSIQYGMWLGLSLPSMDNIPELIEQRQASEPTISFINVFDTRGEILFHTDAERVGERVPAAWQALLASDGRAEGIWSYTTPDDYLIAIPLINSFNRTEGALLLGYSRTQTTAVTGQVKRQLIELSAFVIAGFGLLSLLCALLVLRRLSKSLLRLERSLKQTAEGARAELSEDNAQGELEQDVARFQSTVVRAREELQRDPPVKQNARGKEAVKTS